MITHSSETLTAEVHASDRALPLSTPTGATCRCRSPCRTPQRSARGCLVDGEEARGGLARGAGAITPCYMESFIPFHRLQCYRRSLASNCSTMRRVALRGRTAPVALLCLSAPSHHTMQRVCEWLCDSLQLG